LHCISIHKRTIRYNFDIAFPSAFETDFLDFSYSKTVFQANSPKGNIFIPYLFASALEACPLAFLAAIPCEIIPVLHKQNALANENSDLGSQPASEEYHSRTVSRGGNEPFGWGTVNCASVERRRG